MRLFSREKTVENITKEDDTLELMKYHITQAEEEIKRIHEAHTEMIHGRMKNPTWHREFQGHPEYVSRQEEIEFEAKINDVNRKLLKTLSPLIEKLQKS
jgi:hypothetical protein